MFSFQYLIPSFFLFIFPLSLSGSIFEFDIKMGNAASNRSRGRKFIKTWRRIISGSGNRKYEGRRKRANSPIHPAHRDIRATPVRKAWLVYEYFCSHFFFFFFSDDRKIYREQRTFVNFTLVTSLERLMERIHRLEKESGWKDIWIWICINVIALLLIFGLTFLILGRSVGSVDLEMVFKNFQ